MTTHTESTPAGAERFPFHATRVHPPRSEAHEERVPARFWLAFLALGSVALGLVCFGAYRSLPPRNTENPLRAAVPGSTLKGVGKAETASGKLPGRAPSPQVVHVVWKETEEPPALAPAELARVEMARLEVPPHLPPPPPVPGLPEVLPPPIALPPVEAPELVKPLEVVKPLELPPPLPPVEPPPPPLELPPLPPPNSPAFVDESPLVFARAFDFGDTPMSRNWKTLAFCSLTIIAVAQPAPAAAGDDVKALNSRFDKLDESLREAFKNLRSDIKGISDELVSFKNQLNTLTKEVAKVQADVDAVKLGANIEFDKFDKRMKAVEGQVSKLVGDLDDLRKKLDEPSRAAPALDKAALEDIKGKLSAIEKAILSLAPTTARTAFSPPASGTGRVMLVNSYSEMLLFIINGETHRVMPGTSLPIEGVAAGAVNYVVVSPTWGERARRTATLKAGETFTLSAQAP